MSQPAAATPVVSSKLVLLGDTSVGKSCLVVKFCRNEFCEFFSRFFFFVAAALTEPLFPRPADDYQEPTIGAAFLTQTVQLPEVTVRYEVRARLPAARTS